MSVHATSDAARAEATDGVESSGRETRSQLLQPPALCRGFNTFNGTICSENAVQNVGDVKPWGGETGGAKCIVSTDFESYMQSIEVDASVSYGSAFASADAKVSYVNTVATSTYAVYLAVYATKTTGTMTADGFALAAGVHVPADDADLQSFFDSYGDSFVSGILLGSWYVATYVFLCETLTQQQTVKAALQVTAGGVSADTHTQITSIAQREDTKTQVTQAWAGATFNGRATNLASDLPASATAFLAIAPTPQTAAPIKFEVRGYETVPGFSSAAPGFSRIKATRALFNAGAKGSNVSDKQFAVRNVIDAATDIAEIYAVWSYSADQQLGTRLAQARADQTALENLVRQMSVTPAPTPAYTIPTLDSLTYGIPRLQVQTWASETPGMSNGGQPFNDALPSSPYCPGFVPSGWHVIGLQVHGSVVGNVPFVIDIQVCYEDVDGNHVYVQHGGRASTEGQGFKLLSGFTGGSDASPELDVVGGDQICEIDMWWGGDLDVNNYVRRINVRTVRGRGFEWPAAEPPADAHRWTWPPENNPAHASLLAFSGRSGNNLDQLQLEQIAFSPATWVTS